MFSCHENIKMLAGKFYTDNKESEYLLIFFYNSKIGYQSCVGPVIHINLVSVGISPSAIECRAERGEVLAKIY